MRMRLVAGVSLVAVSGLVAACSPGSTTGSGGVKSSVTVGIGDAFQQTYNLDPYERPTSGELYSILNSTYERLVDTDANGQLVPKLAESWQPDATAGEWTFKLRKGVKFHSGKDVSAEDVVWSFQQMLDPANKLAVTEQFGAFMRPDGITAVDAQTVRFTLSHPVVDFPSQISYLEAVITPKGKTPASLRDAEDGTGPYRVPGWKPGAKTVKLQRFDGYWHGMPKTKEIVLQEMTDSTARTAALQSGQADLITNVDLATVGALKNANQVKIVQSAPAISITLEMQANTAPFNNPDVRRAMKMVVDRDYLVKTIMLGYAVAGSDQPIPPTSPLAWSKETPKQDIEGAKAALARAGYGPNNPLKVELYAAEIQPGAMRVAQAFKEMAAPANISVTIRQAPLDQYWDVIWMKKPFFMDSWGVRAPTQALPFAYGCKPTYDATKWCNQDYEHVMQQAKATVDTAQRDELFKQAQKIVNDDGGVINVLFFKSVNAVRSGCEGFTPPVPFYQVDYTALTCRG